MGGGAVGSDDVTQHVGKQLLVVRVTTDHLAEELHCLQLYGCPLLGGHHLQPGSTGVNRGQQGSAHNYTIYRIVGRGQLSVHVDCRAQ